MQRCRLILTVFLVVSCLLMFGCDSKEAMMDLTLQGDYEAARAMAARMYKNDREMLIAWLTTISEHEGARYLNKLVIQDGWEWNYDSILDTIEGRIKNEGDRTVEYLEITVKFLDTKDGNVIDSDWTNIAREIGPGEQASFEILHRRGSGYKWARLEVGKVRLK